MNIEGHEFDFGPLEPLMQDNDVQEIMVNSFDSVYVERSGKLETVENLFDSDAALTALVQSLMGALGQRLDESSPIVDIHFLDGTRMHVVGRPIAPSGPALVISKFPDTQPTTGELIEWGCWSEKIVDYLDACVQSRLNIVVSGGAGSGKTTVLRRIAEMIPGTERILLIRNEHMRLPQKHVVVLETRPANVEGKGAITAEQLIESALQMRPERIILTEAFGPEVMIMLQAINSGHSGAMFSIHANSPRDALSRLEIMATMAGADVPLPLIREQIASAIDVIVYQERLRDGKRRVMHVSEVLGLHGGVIATQDIFEFIPTGMEGSRITGEFATTGAISAFSGRFEDCGVGLADLFFAPAPGFRVHPPQTPFPPDPRIPPQPPFPPQPPTPPGTPWPHKRKRF